LFSREIWFTYKHPFRKMQNPCWKTNLNNWLLVQVSKYTGRIHLYSCILGKDSRPQPLYENFQPEELESLNLPAANDSKETDFKFLKGNPVSRHALLSFIKEWNALRPIERRKLRGKTLQLPLRVELCYLNESTNHKIGVCLRFWFIIPPPPTMNWVVWVTVMQLCNRDCWRVEASDALLHWVRSANLYHPMPFWKRYICQVAMAKRKSNTLRVGPWWMSHSVNSVKCHASKSRFIIFWCYYLLGFYLYSLLMGWVFFLFFFFPLSFNLWCIFCILCRLQLAPLSFVSFYCIYWNNIN
jgi:hypothetical protein